MKKYLVGALTANAASLGYNWIYNMPYLERLSKSETLTFQKADPDKYKRARKATLAYPGAEVGDVSLQGDILKWVYDLLKENPEASRDDYASIVYDQIKPGGPYYGWIESYGQKLIFNHQIDHFETNYDKLEMDDDQLVGLVPYLACKELDLSNDLAWDLAQAFTNNDEYVGLYKMFDALFNALKTLPIKDALKESLKSAPMQFGFKLTMAVNMEDTKSFIMQLVNTSCPIRYAVPLIYNILANTSSYQEAVELNTKLGGASSDRGLLIGAIYAQVSDIPKTYLDYMTF